MLRTLKVALICLPVFLLLSYPWRDATSGLGSVVSTIGWFGFMLSALVVLVLAVAVGVKRLTVSRT